MADNTNPQTTPSGVNPITKLQPQVAQLELLYRGPLVAGSQVEKFADLVTKINPKYSYEHKLIWVKEYKAHYYLDNGNGTELQNWKKAIARVVLQKYNPEETYQKDDCVHLSGKIYAALQDVPKNHSPLDYDDYWYCIAGETETYRYLFRNTPSVLVYTEIRNPLFEVWLGDIVTDPSGQPVINEITGLVEMVNMEKVDVEVIRMEELENNDGVPYQINFYDDGALTGKYTGCVNVK